jgi:DMSO reductase anchor subunit
MHPALSIIIFTTASGLGYGLAAVLGLGLLDPNAMATKIAHVLALALIAGGLLSSTLHLGNPQRAWRAFSQWRSSWLSREGVMAVVTFLPLAWLAAAAIFGNRYAPVAGLLGVLFAGVTVYCTAMIYASLRSVQAWNTPLTPLCYLMFAAAGGLVLASFFSAAAGGVHLVLLSVVAILVLIGAWVAKIFWRRRMLTTRPLSTPESATGLGIIGSVRPFEPPHMTENYLTREMGYRIARKHARKLAVLSLVFGGAIPVLLLAMALFAGDGAILWTGLAVVSHIFGMLLERWLFFAEARHAVMNYY